jgi:poly-gamma-glutamate synthesis protein (capsule biosynthesis protein)
VAITLFLAGDVMTGRGIDQILPRPSVPHLYEPNLRDAREYVALSEEASGHIPRPVNFAYVWGDALSELSATAPDARIINLETSVTRSETAWPRKEVLYRMCPDNVPCLTAARLDVCVLANNHVLDWGDGGLVETLDTLQAAGIRTAGAGRLLDDAGHPAIVDVEDRARVVVFAFGHASSGIPSEWAAGMDRPGVMVVSALSEDVADAIAEQVRHRRRPNDVVVVSIHWGSNWGYPIPPAQARFAHALIDRGIDLVHGHSSHHPRPIEVYRRKVILYGCGDFLNDYEGISGFEEYLDNLVLMYFPNIDLACGEIVQMRMVPFRIRKMRLERASANERTWLHETLSRISAPYGTRIETAADGSLLVRP